jgi:WD40 repeat protein
MLHQDGAILVRDLISAPFPACYSAIPGPDPNSFITCGSNGSVLLWDLRDTRSPARDFRGHSEAATCGDILSAGTKACERWSEGCEVTC